MKFRIGQRVRIVLSENPELQYLVGSEATIHSMGTSPVGSPYTLKTDLPLRRGKCLGAWDRHIEPAGDAREVITWADLAGLWQPNKENA